VNGINEKIEKIIRDVLELESDFILSDNMCSEDIEEWDSLSSMSLFSCFEKEFNVTFTFDEMVEMDTIADIKRVISNKLNS